MTISRGGAPGKAFGDRQVTVRGQFRELFIEIVFGEIDAGHPRHVGQGELDMALGVGEPGLFAGQRGVHEFVR